MWLALSILAHIAALALFIAQPGLWPLALGLVAIDHGVILFASLWPRSRLLGFNLRRLPKGHGNQVALTFDDGPDPEVTPHVLRMLSAYGARATFFCIGERALNYPELVRAIVTAGHHVENHSCHHAPYFAFLGPRAI